MVRNTTLARPRTIPTYFPQQPTYTSPQPAIPNVQQATQSGPASPSVCGRVISNPDSIAPQEVPMDGSISVFPMQDNSAIFVKRWNADGTIALFTTSWSPCVWRTRTIRSRGCVPRFSRRISPLLSVLRMHI